MTGNACAIQDLPLSFTVWRKKWGCTVVLRTLSFLQSQGITSWLYAARQISSCLLGAFHRGGQETLDIYMTRWSGTEWVWPRDLKPNPRLS